MATDRSSLQAHVITEQRAKWNFIHLPRPTDYKGNERNYEFKVYLGMLQGGSGRHYQSTKLYFSYKVSFYGFLRTLQDATQLCIIPPHRINAKTSLNQVASAKITRVNAEPTTREPKLSRDDIQEVVGPFHQQLPLPSSSSRFVSVSLSDGSSSKDNSTLFGHVNPVMASQKIQVIKNHPIPKASDARENPKPHHGRDQGYTLDDGPWSYFVVNTASPPSGRIWLPLADTDEYAEMLETIKWHVRVNPNDEIVAIVMHVSQHL